MAVGSDAVAPTDDLQEFRSALVELVHVRRPFTRRLEGLAWPLVGRAIEHGDGGASRRQDDSIRSLAAALGEPAPERCGACLDDARRRAGVAVAGHDVGPSGERP